MSTFSQTVRLESIDGERSLEIDALVDTGAYFTLVPSDLLTKLGVEPSGTRTVELADGSLVDFDLGEVVVSIGERTVTTPVLFGDNGVEPLLGAYTLEGLLLVVDPVNTRLIPLRLRMVSHPSV